MLSVHFYLTRGFLLENKLIVKVMIQIHLEKWKKILQGRCVVYYIGNIEAFLIKKLASEKSPIISQIFVDFCMSQKSNFSILLEREGELFAAVDRVCSSPIFYDKNNIYDFSNVPRNTSINEHLLPEYMMCGYVMGSATLDNKIHRIQAGEFLHVDRLGSKTCKKYYTYYPEKSRAKPNNDELIFKASIVFDQAINRTIADANGNKILLPLSGGLDSRLILSKLVEKKYDNLFVFTYGMKNSHEAKMAREVCDKLKIRWHYIPFNDISVDSQDFQYFFKKYMDYCPLISVVPSLMEVMAFYVLMKNSLLDPGVIVVNGQTGDFITGGHVRLDLIGDITKKNVFNYILKKHFSLWPKLLDSNRLHELHKHLADDFSELAISLGYEPEMLAFYEYWEWKERQAKLVLGGQRLYDSFGLNWSLPFWGSEVMDFFRDLPMEYKLNQKLYIDYLKSYNYKNVFDVIRYPSDPWPSKYKSVRYGGYLVGLLLGRKAKITYYKYMDFYSLYNDQYKILGRNLYNQYWKDIRNPVSLSVLLSLSCMNLNVKELFSSLVKY